MDSLTGVDAMEQQEPSVDHSEVLAVRSSDRVVTEEVEMSDVVSVPVGSTMMSADSPDHRVPVTEPLQLAAAGPSVDDGLADAEAAATRDEEHEMEQLENVQVAIKVRIITDGTY